MVYVLTHILPLTPGSIVVSLCIEEMERALDGEGSRIDRSTETTSAERRSRYLADSESRRTCMTATRTMRGSLGRSRESILKFWDCALAGAGDGVSGVSGSAIVGDAAGEEDIEDDFYPQAEDAQFSN